MSIASTIDDAVTTVYRGRVKDAMRALGVSSRLAGLYWAVRRTVGSDTTSHTVDGVSAEFYIPTLSALASVNADRVAERPIHEHLLATTRSDDVFWDVGANVGAFTCLAGQITRETIAFEPYPPTADLLERNVELNGIDADVRRVALSETNGEGNLTLVKNAEAGSREHSLDGYGDPEGSVDTVSVPLVSGDELVADGLEPPTIVKMDVEGAAPAVIEGMRDSLSEHCRRIYVEPHGNRARIVASLRELGFDVELVEQNREGAEQFVVGTA